MAMSSAVVEEPKSIPKKRRNTPNKEKKPKSENSSTAENNSTTTTTTSTADVSESTTTDTTAPSTKSATHNHDHFDDGGCDGGREESQRLISRMTEALRKARSDGHPSSGNKNLPLSAASQYLASHNIKKRILHTGNASRMPNGCTAPGGGIAYPEQSKFVFDYRIRDPDQPDDFLDDTKKYGKRMELYSGKAFQIEFWEYCLQTMMVGEVSSFMVPPRQLTAFPVVNKKLRDYMLDRTEADAANPAKHSCAFMSLQAQGGLGYPDLDDLVKRPRILEFIFDLHSVLLPNEAPKETWIMTPEEKVEAIPRLRQEGNELYRQERWFDAAAKYEEALNLIEQLVLCEKPGEPEFVRLDTMRVPFYVNMAQCQFKLKDYYGSIRSTTEALARDKENVKALFRRGQAYAATSDVKLAEADFVRVRELAPDTMAGCVAKELANLQRISRECREQERRLLAGKVFSR